MQSVSGLSLEVNLGEVQQVTKGGDQFMRKQAVGAANGDVTIVRGPEKSAAFTDWVKRTLAEGESDEANPDLTITQHDGDGQPAHRVKPTGARATAWNGPELDASGADLAKETVTLAYGVLTVE